MTIPYNYLRARVRLDDLVHNFHFLRERTAGPAEVVPVVKADAYGHGLLPAAGALRRAGAATFAVGTVEEALALRTNDPDSTIIALLGPLFPDEDEALWTGRITPFVHSFEVLSRLVGLAGTRGPLDVAIKCDTGMSRLGFIQADMARLVDVLAGRPELRVTYLASHLATSDDPEAFGYVVEQAETFRAIGRTLAAAGHVFRSSLCNSAGILAHREHHFEAVRAGIALYGANPFHGTPLAGLGHGLRPAMDVVTRVVSVHDLPSGRSISYGRTFTAPRDMRVAVVAAGYADGYSRGLSNRGFFQIRGTRVPIVGRVCMQLTAADVGAAPDVAPGDEAFLLGGEGESAIRPEELADWWDSIPYEAFCILGLNKREYVSRSAG